MMRILLVDDELELVSTLSERLLLRAIEAEWATSGSEALQRVESKSFDLAVLDIKMPGIGGFELKKRLLEKCPEMKFLFLTGYGSEKEFHEIINELGRDSYMVKPVDIDDLIVKISTILADRGKQ